MANWDWFDFKNPDYDRVIQCRMDNLDRLRAEPSAFKPLKEFYKDNPVDFINDWGSTFDPRNAEIGLPTVIPFILFQHQRECINWLVKAWKGRKDGLIEKSRDMGISWLCVAFAVWMWSYYEGTVIGFGSRKEDYVDKLGNPGALFYKIRQFINGLPKELRPLGYSDKFAPHMRIINPENGASIVGEAGDNIGRGNRTSIYFKDESAFYERPELIDASLSQTSNCKIDVSTPNGNGNPFFRKRHAEGTNIFSFHWTKDPRKDEVWYAKQKKDLDPVILAQEVDIDYNASTTDAWISGEIVTAAQRVGVAQVDPIGQWIMAIDAAHYGDDETVIHMRRGRLNLPQVVRRGVDGVQLAGLVEEQCSNLLLTGTDVYAIVVELDGPGVSCFDQLKKGKYANKVQGIHTGSRMSDGKNYNLKAKMWRDARDYLASPPVSLPEDQELKSQLCSVKYQYKDGLLIMQSKKEYKGKLSKSPDRADAFVLTFAAAETPQRDVRRNAVSGGWMS